MNVSVFVASENFVVKVTCVKHVGFKLIHP